MCFSNEFSTFSHKIVYMDWQIGDEGCYLTFSGYIKVFCGLSFVTLLSKFYHIVLFNCAVDYIRGI